MSDDRISSFIDRDGIRDDKEYIIAVLNEIKTKVQEVDKIKLSLFGSATIRQAMTDIKNLMTAVDSFHQQQLKGIQIAIQEEKLRREKATSLVKEIDLELKRRKLEASNQAQASKGSGRGGGGGGEAVPKTLFEQLKKDAKEAKKAFEEARFTGAENAKELFEEWKKLEAQIREVTKETKNVFSGQTEKTKQSAIAALRNEADNTAAALTRVKTKMTDLAKTQIGRNSAEFKRLSDEADRYNIRLKSLEAQLSRLSETEKERINASRKAGEIASQVDKSIAEGTKLNSNYKALELTLADLQERGRELAAKGLLRGLSEDEAKRLAEIQLQATDTANALAKIDNQLGKGAKSQYAYAQQLFSLQQVLRETPNIAFGWNIFLASLSNNIPILADDILRLKERNKELAAAGKPTVNIMTQIGNAIKSVSGVIALLVAAFTILSAKWNDWILPLFRSAEANRRAFLASKQYYELLKKQAELINTLITSYEKLNKILSLSNNENIRAVREQLALAEALGLNAGALFIHKKKIADFEAQTAKEEFDRLAKLVRTEEIRDKLAENRALKARKEFIQKGAEGDISRAQLRGDQNEIIKIAKRAGEQTRLIDEQIAQNNLEIEEELIGKKLSDEELLQRKKEKNINLYKQKQLEVLQVTQQLQTDIEEKKQRGQRVGLSKKELETLNQSKEAKEKELQNIGDIATLIINTIDNIHTTELRKRELAQEKIKFDSDELRKKILSNARATADGVISINEDILNDERRTEREKLAAIDKISDAKKKIAAAEREDVLKDLSATDVDKRIVAENEYATKIKQIDIDRLRDRQNILDAFLDRRIDAIRSSLEAEKSITLRINKDIQESQLADLIQRSDALAETFKIRKQLLDDSIEGQLKSAGLTQKERQDFINTGVLQRLDYRKTQEELLAIRSKYIADIHNLNLDAADDNINILVNELARTRDLFDRETAAIKDSLTEAQLSSDQKFTDELRIARESNLSKLTGAGKLAGENLRITREQERERLKIIGESLQKELLLHKNTLVDKDLAEQQYESAKRKLATAITAEQTQRAEKELGFAKKQYDEALEFYRALLELLGLIKENEDQTRANTENERRQDIEAEMQLWQLRFDLAARFADFYQSALEGNFQRRLQMIDDEMSALDKKAEKERGIIEQSVVDEEERAKRIAEIDIKSANQKEVLEAKRRKLERDKAVFEKQAAILRIVLDTAATIVKLNLQAAAYNTNPFTAALGKATLAQIPFVIAQSALGVATIAAQPLPKLAKGTKDFGGGFAILGDAGKSELVIEPDGSMFVSSSIPEIHHLKKHSAVLPDADAAITVAKKRLDGIIGTFVNPDFEVPGFDRLNATMQNGFNHLSKTIKNKPEIILRRGINKDLLLRYGADYWKYID